jgi:hypothetical protein
MKSYFHHSLLIAVGVSALAVAVPACSSGDDDSGNTAGTGGSTGGTTGAGGTGGGTSTGNVCSPDAKGDTTLIPSDMGWVDHQDACNDVNVQGSWYPYGDQYGMGEGDAKCIKVGLHMPSECAQITSPMPPPATGFPNVMGQMHTTGTVESILACPAGITTSGCPPTDYSNMWGAGIGFDFNADGADQGGMKHVWDPDTVGVIGVAFTIHGTPLNFRVEFPMQLTPAEAAADMPPITIANPTTDSHSAGAPYWGAQANGDAKFPKSPVVDGQENKIFFDDAAATTGIESPNKALYKFDRHRMLGMQFHVVAGVAAPYDFTISNVRFLRTR